MESIGDVLQMETCTEQRHCETHGAYQGEFFRLGPDREWHGGDCPQCLAEREEQKRKDEQERTRSDRVSSLLARSGVPKRYRDVDFEDFETATDRATRIRDYCQRYAETFPERRAEGTNLILSGGVGTGKTHIVCAMTRKIIHTHCEPVIYTSVIEIHRRVKASYDRNAIESETDVLETLSAAPLLIIDEVGVQSGSDHEHQVIFEVLNRRYNAILPTVVVTNLGVSELEESIGERVVDRLREGGYALVFDWGSYRRSKK